MHSTSGESIDIAALDALRGILREEFDQVIDSFLRNAQRCLSLVEIGIAEGDRAAVILSSHKLSTTAGQVGLTRLSDLARELERKAGHAPRMEMDIIMSELDKAFSEARDALVHRIAKRDH